jgi:hypothetical protein
MLKQMVSAPAEPFASVIAVRSVPPPLLLLLVTMNVAAWTGPAASTARSASAPSPVRNASGIGAPSQTRDRTLNTGLLRVSPPTQLTSSGGGRPTIGLSPFVRTGQFHGKYRARLMPERERT